MTRSLVVILFILLFAFPEFANAHKDKPAIPCSDLWSAVTDTIANTGNYTVVASDPARMRASFIVVGALYPGMNAVFLSPRHNGCQLEVRMSFTGIDDEAALRKRVRRSLTKLRAAQPSAPAQTAGTE
ncbi:MAG TPA: hypothetical protein VK764_01130 [Terracidiphilus sp.]|nr:hypothetical protein [Terracidiphilus sp.]